MTNEQRELLKPWSELYARLEERLASMTPEARKSLYEAALSVSTANCWCMTYRAAKILRGTLEEHFGRAVMQEIKRADDAAQNS